MIVQIAIISLLSPENVEQEAGLLGEDINIQLIGWSLLEQGASPTSMSSPSMALARPSSKHVEEKLLVAGCSPRQPRSSAAPLSASPVGRVALRASCPSSAAWEPIRKLLLHPEEAEWDSLLPSVLSVLSPVFLLD